MLIDESPEQHIKEYKLSGVIADILLKHYQDHLWGVHVDMRGGVVQVTNMRLSGRWGFILHLDKVLLDPTNKIIINAGGELLERYRLSRGKFSESQYQQLNTDTIGDFVADK